MNSINKTLNLRIYNTQSYFGRVNYCNGSSKSSYGRVGLLACSSRSRRLNVFLSSSPTLNYQKCRGNVFLSCRQLSGDAANFAPQLAELSAQAQDINTVMHALNGPIPAELPRILGEAEGALRDMQEYARNVPRPDLPNPQ